MQDTKALIARTDMIKKNQSILFTYNTSIMLQFFCTC